MLNRAFSLLVLLAAFVSTVSAQDSLNVRKLFHWNDTTIPDGTPYLNRYNEVWGYAANGREYAIIGSTMGTHVFDVTDPVNSTQVDFVAGRFTGIGVIHRDYKTYADHLYAVCDEGQSSLQIMDLRYLPDSVHVVYDSTVLLRRAHNIQIDSVNARMYTCGGSSQFAVYSLANPAEPVLVSNLEENVPWWSSTVGYVHDCFVRDNIVWCNDQDAMHVLDMTVPTAPVILGAMTIYPGQGYNHSGWLNDDGTVYAMADETHGSPLKFIDATDSGDLDIVSTVTSGIDATSIVHNPFYHGDNVHVAYYYDGYWLWNTADPAQPILLGYYDTSLEPNSDNYKGAWGVYPYLPSGRVLVSDMQTGLWVLDIDQATSTAEARATPPYRVGPTLTNGVVRVNRLDGNAAPVRIDVINSTGQLMQSSKHSTQGVIELDISGFNNGMYMVVVNNGSNKYTQRIVKGGHE